MPKKHVVTLPAVVGHIIWLVIVNVHEIFRASESPLFFSLVPFVMLIVLFVSVPLWPCFSPGHALCSVAPFGVPLCSPN